MRTHHPEPIRVPETLGDVRRWIRVAERILNDVTPELIMSPGMTHAEDARPGDTVARALDLMTQLQAVLATIELPESSCSPEYGCLPTRVQRLFKDVGQGTALPDAAAFGHFPLREATSYAALGIVSAFDAATRRCAAQSKIDGHHLFLGPSTAALGATNHKPTPPDPRRAS